MNLDQSNQGTFSSSGFASGTLVQTNQGLCRIDALKVGDLVMVPSGSDPSEHSFLPVVKVGRVDDAPMVMIRLSIEEGEHHHNDTIALAGLPFFHVRGFDPRYSEDDIEYYKSKMGWQEIRKTDGGHFLATSTNALARVWNVGQIWKTRDPDTGWVAIHRESEMGDNIVFHDGDVTYNYKDTVVTDQIEDSDFLLRYETAEMAERWAYKATAYSVETEGFQPIYVGRLGLLVHPGRISEVYPVWAHERIWE